MLSLLKHGLDALVHPTIRLKASTDFPLTGKALGIAYVVGFVLFIVGSVIPALLFVGLVALLLNTTNNETAVRMLDFLFQHSGEPKSITIALMMVSSFAGGFAAQMSFLSWLLRRRGYKLSQVVGLSTLSLRGRTALHTAWNIIWRAAVVFALVLGGEMLLNMVLPMPEQPTVEFARKMSGGTIWVFFVIAAIAAPLLEEFCFRGVLFQALRATFHRRKWARADLLAVTISGAVFALWHMQFHPVQLLVLFLMGCVLAETFRRTGTLWTSIALHALNNGLAALLLILSQSS